MSTLSPEEVARLRADLGVTIEGEPEKPAVKRPKPSEPIALVAHIRRLRLQRNWSLDTLAGKSGMASVRIGSYERGDRQPSAAVLAEIFDALGYEIRVVPKDAPDVDTPARHAALLRHIAERIEHGRG